MKRIVSSCSLATPIYLTNFAIGAFVGFVVCCQVDCFDFERFARRSNFFFSF